MVNALFPVSLLEKMGSEGRALRQTMANFRQVSPQAKTISGANVMFTTRHNIMLPSISAYRDHGDHVYNLRYQPSSRMI